MIIKEATSHRSDEPVNPSALDPAEVVPWHMAVRNNVLAPGGRRLGLRILIMLPFALGAVAAVLAMVTAEKDVAIAGLPDAGRLNEYSLRAVRALAHIAAAATIGTLLILSFLVPSTDLKSDDRRTAWLCTMVRRWAVMWFLASSVLVVLTCAEVVGLGPGKMLTGLLFDVVLPLPAARALLPTIAAAFIVALWASSAGARVVAWPLLVLSMAALVPPLFTSHSGHSSERDLAALLSLLAHVPAAAVWVGGLMALVMYLRACPTWLNLAVPRFSRLAGACFATVAISGAIAVYSRIPAFDQLWTTHYGRLVLAKFAVLVTLGICGALHRRRTVRALGEGRPGSLLRLATGELVIMASALGLAAALATTAPPT